NCDWRLFAAMADDATTNFEPALVVCPLLAVSFVQREIGLSAAESAKLKAISDHMKAAAKEIFNRFAPEEKINRLPAKEQAAKRADRERQLQALGKETLRQIRAALTPAQSAALDKLAAEIKATFILEYGSEMAVSLTPEQRTKINQLRDEQ